MLKVAPSYFTVSVTRRGWGEDNLKTYVKWAADSCEKDK